MRHAVLSVALGVVALALAPTCWLAPFTPPLPAGADVVDQEPADIVQQGDVTHFVYREELQPAHVALRYLRWDATGETGEDIVSSNHPIWVSTAPSLAVTPDGAVNVVWGCPGNLCYARRAPAGGWTTTGIAAPDDQPTIVRIAAGPSGVLHVVWRPWSAPGTIKYLRWDSGAWQGPESVLPLNLPQNPTCPDLNVVDVNGEPSVVVACETPGLVQYAHRDADGTWRGTTISSGAPAEAADIAFSPIAPTTGGTGEEVLWCGGSQANASAMVRSIVLGQPIYDSVTSIIAPSNCAPGSTGISADADGTFHAVFAGIDHHPDPGPAVRSLVYARLVPGGTATAVTDVGEFCTGRPPYPTRDIGVDSGPAGVFVSWQDPLGSGLGSRAHWTRGLANLTGDACQR